MRPETVLHLYDLSMVPNLLPFSASVTTGAGSTPSATATPQGQPGFAAMLGLGTTPVTQAVGGNPVTVSVVPPGTAPLLELIDGTTVRPVEEALPELLTVADPATTPVVPEATPVVPVVTPVPQAPAEPVATLPEAPVKATAPAPSPSPEGGSVTVVDGPLKTPELVLETVTVVDGPYKPDPIAKPAPQPAPTEDGGTVTVVDRPDKSVETAPGPTAPIVKPAEPAPAPAPAPAPGGGSVTIVEPVRKTGGPKTAPVVEEGSVTVVDGPRKDAVSVTETAQIPFAPVETAPIAAPVEAAPAVTEVVADPLPAAGPDEAPAPQAQPAALAAVPLATPAPVATSPAPLQRPNDAAPEPASAPVVAPAAAARPAEPAPTDIMADLPVDDGAFDGLVADAAPDAEPLRTSGDTASDTMSRDGNRQPAPQPAAPAPTPASAGPVPSFDQLATAPAPNAPRTASESAAEPRARASALGEDVGLAIVRHADTGSGDVLVIRLDPAELGKIEVRLRMDEARQLSAEVTADQPATLEMLRRDSDSLTRALSDAGFRADDQSLRFDSRGFGQNDQQAQQGRRVASRAYLPEDDASASSIPSPVQVRSSGRVDLVA